MNNQPRGSVKVKMTNFTRVPNKLARSPCVSRSAKALYLAIASCNPSFPSYRRLQKWTRMSFTTISKALKELSQLKIISYKKGHAHRKANEYHLLPEESWSLSSPIPGASKFVDHYIGESGTATAPNAPGLQNLESMKTNGIIIKEEEQLSQSRKKLHNYITTLKPISKRRTETEFLRELDAHFAVDDIADCLSHLLNRGIDGQPCHSPMAYLAKSMTQVLEKVKRDSAKLRKDFSEEKLNQKKFSTQCEADEREDSEIRTIDQAFCLAFPLPKQRKDSLQLFAREIPPIVPEIGRNILAKQKWWETLSATEREQWKTRVSGERSENDSASL